MLYQAAEESSRSLRVKQLASLQRTARLVQSTIPVQLSRLTIAASRYYAAGPYIPDLLLLHCVAAALSTFMQHALSQRSLFIWLAGTLKHHATCW